MKILFSIFIAAVLSFAVDVVPIATKTINYKEKIYSHNVKLVQANDKYKCKKYLDVKLLKQNKYHAKHYIAKNKPLCLKNVYVPVSKKVTFKFGNLEIEREGEVVRETDRYIKIKTLDGKIEKIYKDGRN